MQRTMLKLAGPLLAATLAAGCASTPVPEGTFAPDQTIAAAEERGAEDNPQAKLHLQLAREQLDEARALKEEGEEAEAKLKLATAQVDAEYALALLRRDAARAEAEEIQEQIESLRQEMQGTTTEEAL